MNTTMMTERAATAARGPAPHARDHRRPRRARWSSHFLVLLALATLAAPSLAGQTVFQNPASGYIIDIPAGWGLLDGADASLVSFTDPDRVAVFQVLTYPSSDFVTVDELARHVADRYGASGDQAPFRYLDRPAIFADWRFDTGRIEVRGYMVFTISDEWATAIMTMVPEFDGHYDRLIDTTLSALDSYSPSTRTRNYPGPVSQFFAEPAEEAAALQPGGVSDRELRLPSGAVIPLPARIGHPDLIDAASQLIEREARVLAGYAPQVGTDTRFPENAPPLWAVAWRRYFRMIFRDNYDRMEPVAEAIFDDLAAMGVRREEMPARILEWLQGARYERTRSLSDLASPSWCLVEFAGDCDSLGITYAIILHHLGFDAILMASIEYEHAMVGVDVAGVGARFPFSGREWLVAELTETVGIGQIAQEMSDIGGWIGVKLDPTIIW